MEVRRLSAGSLLTCSFKRSMSFKRKHAEIPSSPALNIPCTSKHHPVFQSSRKDAVQQKRLWTARYNSCLTLVSLLSPGGKKTLKHFLTNLGSQFIFYKTKASLTTGVYIVVRHNLIKLRAVKHQRYYYIRGNATARVPITDNRLLTTGGSQRVGLHGQEHIYSNYSDAETTISTSPTIQYLQRYLSHGFR